MYLPAAFRDDRIESQHELIRSHPLATLITAGAGGLMANPLPFLLHADGGDKGVLRAHLARANPQCRELQSVDEALVVFQGPQAYVSPSLYASKREHGKVVPTWNYATVHAWGRPRLIDDKGWLRALVEALTRIHEAPRSEPWAVDDAPADYIDSMLQAIVGLEIPIARIEGKWKVSQNRPPADRQGVADGLGGDGEAGRAMAALVVARAPGG